MVQNNPRLIDRWLNMKLGAADRSYQSKKDSWNVKASFKGAFAGSHHVIGWTKIMAETIREYAADIFNEIGTVSSDRDRFDLAEKCIISMLDVWHGDLKKPTLGQKSFKAVQPQTDEIIDAAKADIATLAELSRTANAQPISPESRHLALWLDDRFILTDRLIANEINVIRSDLAFRKSLKSGARIKYEIGVWDKHLKQFKDAAFAYAKEIHANRQAFDQLSEATSKLLSKFEMALPKIVWFPNGKGGPNDQSLMAGARKLFERTKDDLVRSVALEEIKFSDTNQNVQGQRIAHPPADHVSVTIPNGFISIKIAYRQLADALTPPDKTLNKAIDYDEHIELERWKKAQQTDFTAVELLRCAISLAFHFPHVSVWTRRDHAMEPEIIDPDTLASTKSLSWERTIKAGSLIVFSDPKLLPMDRWPVFFTETDWKQLFGALVEIGSGKVANAKKPPLPNAKLKTWWDSLARTRDSMSREKLMEAVEAKFPDHSISRDRIRELTPGRKRGKKPISGKPTAK